MTMNSNSMSAGIITLFLLLPIAGISRAANFVDAKFSHIEYPAWFASNPFHDLAEELGKARAKRKTGLMIAFHTEGCSYCGEFVRQSLQNPRIAARVQQHFISVGLEIFDDEEMTDPGGIQISIKQFAKREGAGFSPTLLFYDVHGKQVLRVVGYQDPERFTRILDYVIDGHHKKYSLARYFAQFPKKTPARSKDRELKHDPLFIRPPYALDRSRFAADKPLVVLFEEKACIECLDFHRDVLALREVRETLAHFEVVRLDAADSRTPVLAPGGQRLTPASWYEQTTFARVPALLFFDEKGNEVLRTDALVKRQRMMNSLNYVLERAYLKDWTYQRFARTRALSRSREKQKQP